VSEKVAVGVAGPVAAGGRATRRRRVAARAACTSAAAAQSIKLIELVSQSINKTDNASALNSLSEVGRRLTSSSGARFTKYLMTILRLSYDNAKVTIDLP